MKLDHIGIAVKSIEESAQIYEDITGACLKSVENIETQGVQAGFIYYGEQKVELLASLTKDGPIARFINRRGEGMHHIAFLVEDIHSEMTRLKDMGYTLINDEPVIGAGNRWVCFIHPKATNGVLIELCQERDDS